MADIWSRKKRSEVMARIRGKDTRPEAMLRSALHRLGFRFRKNDRRLPGAPDIVLPRYHTVILVHGCFWHGHKGCPDFVWPKTRKEFWRAKILGNRRRDVINRKKLEAAGWRVIEVWECELGRKQREADPKVLARIVRVLRRGDPE